MGPGGAGWGRVGPGGAGWGRDSLACQTLYLIERLWRARLGPGVGPGVGMALGENDRYTHKGIEGKGTQAKSMVRT